MVAAFMALAKFQSLIGKVKSSTGDEDLATYYEFQSLIGKVKRMPHLTELYLFL